MYTQQRLREVLDYNTETGKLVWKVSKGRVRAGREAGAPDGRGYIQIRVDGHNCRAHRLVWFWFYGKWPVGELDHINGVRDDNRICNLREATISGNRANSERRLRELPRGVYRHYLTNKYRAQVAGKHLGFFETVEEASTAYQKAAAARFGEFAYAKRQGD